MDDGSAKVMKGAILLERRGGTFYADAASRASSDAVRRLFTRLADEEAQHQAWLEEVFVQSATEGSESGFSAAATRSQAVDAVLVEEVVRGIEAASFESAVISAAMGLEERAVAYYARGAEEAGDPGSRRVCAMLADWERVHLEMLSRIEAGLERAALGDPRPPR